MTNTQPEPWLCGPVPAVPDLLQPVAHALLQSIEDVKKIMTDFPEEKLWERPVHLASTAFHLQHITGVLDRMSSYAAGNLLTEQQLHFLAAEGKKTGITSKELVSAFEMRVALFINDLKEFDPGTLTNYRPVGRKKLPSTVIGILFHAAEHVQRHTGQLLVTAKVVR